MSRAYSTGSMIFDADNLDWVGLVHRGMVRVYAEAPDGRRVTVRYVGEGGIVGLGPLVGMPDNVGAHAVGRAELLQLNVEHIRLLRRTDPAFNLAIAREIHDRLRDTSATATLRLRGSLIQRLAVDLVERAGATTGDWHPVVHVTHEQLAEAVGTSREVASRVLHALAGHGLIRQVGRGTVLLADPERLARMGQAGRFWETQGVEELPTAQTAHQPSGPLGTPERPKLG